MDSKGALSVNPVRQSRRVAILAGVWLSVILVLGFWWASIVLNQSERIAELGPRAGIPEAEALKMITINAAKTLELEKRIGSIEVGKDGDIAVFDKHPLNSTTKCVMTIIEGQVFFDYAKEKADALTGVSHD